MPLPHLSAQGTVTASSGLSCPEAGGAPCLRLRISCDSWRHTGAGNWAPGDTSTFTAVLFGEQARLADRAFQVGDKVTVQGPLRTNPSGHPEVMRPVIALLPITAAQT